MFETGGAAKGGAVSREVPQAAAESQDSGITKGVAGQVEGLKGQQSERLGRLQGRKISGEGAYGVHRS